MCQRVNPCPLPLESVCGAADRNASVFLKPAAAVFFLNHLCKGLPYSAGAGKIWLICPLLADAEESGYVSRTKESVCSCELVDGFSRTLKQTLGSSSFNLISQVSRSKIP